VAALAANLVVRRSPALTPRRPSRPARACILGGARREEKIRRQARTWRDALFTHLQQSHFDLRAPSEETTETDLMEFEYLAVKNYHDGCESGQFGARTRGKIGIDLV
jgi:hypothetical protein